MSIDKQEERKPHSLCIDNRNRCNITGIKKVITANENTITMQSHCGLMTITGANLKLTAFSESNETVAFVGEINSIKYGEKTSALKKIFK